MQVRTQALDQCHRKRQPFLTKNNRQNPLRFVPVGAGGIRQGAERQPGQKCQDYGFFKSSHYTKAIALPTYVK